MKYKKGNTYKAVIKSLSELYREGWCVNANGFLCDSHGNSVYGLRPENPFYGKKLSVTLVEDNTRGIMPWCIDCRIKKYDEFYIPHSFINRFV